jgi:hypothetical protein
MDAWTHPPRKVYTVAINEDWSRCFEINATSEAIARRHAQARLRSGAATSAREGVCEPLPAAKEVDSRAVLGRLVNTSLALAAAAVLLTGGLAVARAWRSAGETSPA